MSIFNIIFGVLLCLAPVALRADDIECGYFNPAFGLCSTHSHNIAYIDGATNLPANPDKSEDVAQMNHVIALKSTVIAQQLKEQYDALNVIIKRFKTQLEKAVLVSKIEVLTGNAASGNSGGASNNSGTGVNKGLASASDCSLIEYDKVFDCLMGNMQKIQQAATNDMTNARNQLDIDLGIINTYTMCATQSGNTTTNVSCTQMSDYNSKCGSRTSSKQISACAAWLYAQVNMAKNRYSSSRSRNYGAGWGI